MTTLYDEDRIPCVLIGETRPRARREHKCSGCVKGIKTGDRYRRRFYLVDGEPWTEKVCRSCEGDEYAY